MWFDILKNTKTISQTSGSFDFDEEEIPEKEEDDCIKRWNAQCKKNESFSQIVKNYLIEDDMGEWETDSEKYKLTYQKFTPKIKSPAGNATYRVSIAWDYLDENTNEKEICDLIELINKAPLNSSVEKDVTYLERSDGKIIGFVDKRETKPTFSRTLLYAPPESSEVMFCSIVITSEKFDEDGNYDENDKQNKKFKELEERAKVIFNVV